MNDFSGKTALVTGAASGIGKQIAMQLGAAGAIVYVTDITDGINAVANEILDRGGQATPRHVNVADRGQLATVIDEVVREHGRLDLIFNNAGVAIFGDYENVTLDDWDKVIDVNLKGVAYGSKLAYDQMVKQGGGQIVNTASVAGLVPVPLQAHYVATKHAIVGMDKTLRIEAPRHNISITTFCPAFIETGMFETADLKGGLEGVDAHKMVPVKPLGADKAVERLLEGVAKRKDFVITPFYGRLGWWMERYLPAVANLQHRLLYRETVRRAKKQRK